MDDPYIAHPAHDGIAYQSVSKHCKNVASLAKENCPVPLLASFACLAGLLHDAGKYRDGFQEYMSKIERNQPVYASDRVDHATAGGQMAEAWFPVSGLSQILQFVIYSHHGLYDAVGPENGEELFTRRLSKEADVNGLSMERYGKYLDFHAYEEDIKRVPEDFQALKDAVGEFVRSGGEKKVYGNRYFYMGMHIRLLLSLLVDGDRTDTACYMQNRSHPERRTEEELTQIWEQGILHLEKRLEQFKGSGRIDHMRAEISHICMKAACGEDRIYRLTVPTGAGKTLSSLRFALHCAKKYKKRHIIYVAPYNSILEQNADVFREALGNPDIVLEHHSNVIFENQDEQEQYQLLTENWQNPVIVTTAVQFLNTLFSSRLSNVRRMYSLCESVIIFDEVQAVPVRCAQLFSMAVNYLSVFCHSTLVLCSATQPLFDKIRKNRIAAPKDMVSGIGRFMEGFRRTKITDKTGLKKGGLSVEELGAFVLEQFQTQKRILVIVNTKSCAGKLYHFLNQVEEKKYRLFHLSTNMCAVNRQDILAQMNALLIDGEETGEQQPVICVSTQLIEAGVDISFDCVIRSLAGLDSIIQSAGRCNRHGKNAEGNVFIVRMSEKAENISSLTDIRISQQVMQSVLSQYRRAPETMKYDLASREAIRLYYSLYFQAREEETAYQVSGFAGGANLVDFLSSNSDGMEEWRRLSRQGRNPSKREPFVKQAFKTAGEKFQVIPEDGKVDIVVEYDEEVLSLLGQLQNEWIGVGEQKKIIRKLQRYTVGISEKTKTALGRALTPIPVYGGVVLALSGGYYSRDTGVSETPVNMKLLMM